jgi:serine/threonine-protein kinase
VYALGLILFETATGSTPFEGSTAEAMLHERLHGPLPTRPELGGLDIVLAQATVPDGLVRLTAEEMTVRLSGVVPDEGPFVKYDIPAPSLLGSFALAEPRQSVGFRPPSPNQIVSSPRSSATFGQSPASRHSAPPRRSAPGAFDDLSPIGGGRRRPVYLAAAVLIIVLAVGGGLAWKLGYLSTKHTAPSVYGLTLAEASSLVKSDGLTLNVTAHVASATVKAGDIVTQSPAAGISVAGGSALSVTVSSGPATLPVTLPAHLLGMTCAAATTTLSALHVTATCPSTSSIPSSTVAKGFVAGWLLGSTRNPSAVPTGATLILETSSGVSTSTSTSTTTTVHAGAPSSTSSSTSTTTTSTTTTTVHTKTLAMPNLAGMSRVAANAALTAAGLYYSTRGPGAGTTKWTHVVSTIPAAGSTVPYMSTVILNVAE